jgi:CHASE3 domain sensor protein
LACSSIAYQLAKTLFGTIVLQLNEIITKLVERESTWMRMKSALSAGVVPTHVVVAVVVVIVMVVIQDSATTLLPCPQLARSAGPEDQD